MIDVSRPFDPNSIDSHLAEIEMREIRCMQVLLGSSSSVQLLGHLDAMNARKCFEVMIERVQQRSQSLLVGRLSKIITSIKHAVSCTTRFDRPRGRCSSRAQMKSVHAECVSCTTGALELQCGA